jgi:hypothetical protein
MYTKRDLFQHLKCSNNDNIINSKQRCSTVVALCNTDKIRKFIKEWLLLCNNEHLITDSKSDSSGKEHVKFIEHRYDQSIFSCLSKLYEFNNFIHYYEYMGHHYFTKIAQSQLTTPVPKPQPIAKKKKKKKPLIIVNSRIILKKNNR